MPDTLEFYFGFVAQGTVCEGARLEQELIPARLAARAASASGRSTSPSFRCPTCGGADVEVVSGNEFEVESIEVEEAACTAPR